MGAGECEEVWKGRATVSAALRGGATLKRGAGGGAYYFCAARNISSRLAWPFLTSDMTKLDSRPKKSSVRKIHWNCAARARGRVSHHPPSSRGARPSLQRIEVH